MKLLLALMLSILLLRSDATEAARLFGSGDFEGAVQAYREIVAQQPESALHRYNLGTAHLRLQRYDSAAVHLTEATRLAGSGDVGQHGRYNLGNADLEAVFADRQREDRLERLRRALEAYKSALLLDSADIDAKWNLELCRWLLEQEPESGGGGGGGGGGDESEQGRQDPQPQPGGPGGGQPRISQQAAERILAAAETRELGVQQEALSKAQPAVQSH